LETTLFDQNVLEAVKQWLEPLPDKSLPALNIQRELFDVLIKVNSLAGFDIAAIRCCGH
jgi:transcription factor SPN1